MEYLILDLENNNGNLNYKINNFPDGQRSITIKESEITKVYKSVEVVIVKSIRFFGDLELILSAVSVLSKHTFNYSLYSPYIIGARSDRKFEVGGDMYFDDIIIPILEKYRFKNIYTFDNHCFRNCLTDLNAWEHCEFYPAISNYYVGMLFPDESAEARFLDIDRMFRGCTMIKERINGEVKQVPENIEDFSDMLDLNNIIIFDDLLDGGKSFVGLCERLRFEYFYKEKITIFVTHFIGSNLENLKRLKELNVEIITTNSYIKESIYVTKQIDLFNKDFILKTLSVESNRLPW